VALPFAAANRLRDSENLSSVSSTEYRSSITRPRGRVPDDEIFSWKRAGFEWNEFLVYMETNLFPFVARFGAASLAVFSFQQAMTRISIEIQR